jgi:O-antigen/teichoic acid export membrane protein
MSPLLTRGDRRANPKLPAFRHARLILCLSIYTLFAAQMMPVGQLFCRLERADFLMYSLSLCAFCTVGLAIVFARWWGVGGVSLTLTLSKVFTSSPIQLYKLRGILRVNRAPALEHQWLAVV